MQTARRPGAVRPEGRPATGRSDQGLREADDHDRRDAERHQHPIRQKAVGDRVVTLTMFVSHVSSSFRTDLIGRFPAAHGAVGAVRHPLASFVPTWCLPAPWFQWRTRPLGRPKNSM